MPEITPEEQPPLLAVPMSLFPTVSTLQEAVNLGNACLPITSQNALYAVLAVYHNTLIQQLENK